MASFGIYDGTDDEPEDERLAREAREAVEKELAEAAAAESLKFRGTNLFSDAVTTGADGGLTTLDPVTVTGTRVDNSGDTIGSTIISPDYGVFNAGAGIGSAVPSTHVFPVSNPSSVYVPKPTGDPTRDKLQSQELARLNAIRRAKGLPPHNELSAHQERVDSAIADYVVNQLPKEYAIQDEIAAEEKLRAAQAEAKRLNDLNPLGPIFSVVKSAATGAWEIIKDPAQGLGNVATNIGQIFEPGADTNVIPLPIPAAVGAGITIAGLANPNDVTMATDNVNKAKAAAAQGRRDGVSEEEQADLDFDVTNMQGVLDAVKSRGSTPSQGGAAGVVTAIGAAAAGGTAAGTGAGAAGTGAGAGGAAAGATQGGNTSILTGQTVPAATGVGSVPDVGPFDVRTAAQVQADAAAAAAAAAQSTPPSVVTPTDGVAAAQAAAAQAAGVVGVQTVPDISTTTPTDWTKVNAAQAAAAQASQTAQTQAIAGVPVTTPTTTKTGPDGLFEQPAATTTPTDWTKVNAAQAAAAQAGQTAQTQAIAGMGVATPTTTQQNPDGTFVVGGGGGGGTNKCPDGSDRPANGICPVIPSTCPAGQEKVNGTCVTRCSAGQERNAQGVCVVPPVNPPPGTTCSGGKVKNAAGVCECPTGQSDNGNGVCVVTSNPPPGGTTTIDPTLILPIPSNPFTMSTITADQRDLYTELGDTTDAFKRRRNALRDVYGDALGDYSNADMDAYERISGRMRGTNAANTEAASAQTIAANRALRDANLADVNRLGGAAKLNRETLNSQLYGNLNQYSTEASAALGRDMDALRLAEAKQLSPEDIRNSQQAAREAWSARGLVNSRGAVGAEILNRDSLARQREAEARAKVQQSYGNLQQATAMEQANVFDPQAAILGGQYGMQTQNYGTNAALYGQSAEQTRGSQDYVRRVFNPMGEYPNNVEDFNANATTAARIAEANNAAAVAAAREAGQYGLVGTALKSGFVQDALTGVWKWVTRGS